MKLSWGICLLVYGAAVWVLLIPALKEKTWRQVKLPPFKKSWLKLGGGLILGGIFSLLAMALQLDIAKDWIYLLGASGLYGLLSGLNLTAEARGIVLMTAGFALFSNFLDASAMQLPLLASFLGLTFAKLFNPDAWEDFIIPGTWLAGLYWLIPNATESMLVPQTWLLAIFMSVGLIVRGLQAFPMLTKVHVWFRPLYLGVTGGLIAWLAVQNMLFHPPFLTWVGLFTGGLVLGFLPVKPIESAETDLNSAEIANSRFFQQTGLIALLLLGIATLVASRLFGTTGWIVLAIGLLANRRMGSYVSVAALFLLSRVLLQAFLTQFSANVTGINITHPYASAALFVGFALMLVLPNWINAFSAHVEGLHESATDSIQPAKQAGFQLIPLGLIGMGSVLFAGFANYFLHAEATASLLLAMVVSGLGVSLLASIYRHTARVLPMFLTLLILTSVLASPELLAWGNVAEKSQKLIVLGIALVVLLAGFLAQQFGSRRKSVQVS